MSDKQQLDLALRVLDQQLIDTSGRRCGKVDDIELNANPGKPGTLTALLVGPKHQRSRTPTLLRLLGLPYSFGDQPSVEIAWERVTEITHVVKLSTDADDLRLAEGDRRLRRWVGRLPHA
jgi:sporulation protein YlmC with PRC-barrel domain